MKAAASFETQGNTNPTTQAHIPGDLPPPYNCHVNLMSQWATILEDPKFHKGPYFQNKKKKKP
jgi:hypothetical protein